MSTSLADVHASQATTQHPSEATPMQIHAGDLDTSVLGYRVATKSANTTVIEGRLTGYSTQLIDERTGFGDVLLRRTSTVTLTIGGFDITVTPDTTVELLSRKG